MDSLEKILIASNDSNFRKSMVGNLFAKFKIEAIEILLMEDIFDAINKEKVSELAFHKFRNEFFVNYHYKNSI